LNVGEKVAELEALDVEALKDRYKALFGKKPQGRLAWSRENLLQRLEEKVLGLPEMPPDHFRAFRQGEISEVVLRLRSEYRDVFGRLPNGAWASDETVLRDRIREASGSEPKTIASAAKAVVTPATPADSAAASLSASGTPGGGGPLPPPPAVSEAVLELRKQYEVLFGQKPCGSWAMSEKFLKEKIESGIRTPPPIAPPLQVDILDLHNQYEKMYGKKPCGAWAMNRKILEDKLNGKGLNEELPMEVRCLRRTYEEVFGQKPVGLWGQSAKCLREKLIAGGYDNECPDCKDLFNTETKMRKHCRDCPVAAAKAKQNVEEDEKKKRKKQKKKKKKKKKDKKSKKKHDGSQLALVDGIREPKNEDGSWLCRSCGEAFTFRRELRGHRRSCDGAGEKRKKSAVAVANPNGWDCDACGAKYEKRDDLRVHRLTCEKWKLKVESRAGRKIDWLVAPDPVFSRAMRDAARLKGERGWECSGCGTCFEKRGDMRTHRTSCEEVKRRRATTDEDSILDLLNKVDPKLARDLQKRSSGENSDDDSSSGESSDDTSSESDDASDSDDSDSDGASDSGGEGNGGKVAPMSPLAAPPKGFEVFWSEEYGIEYYVNLLTEEAVWERPGGFIPSEASADPHEG